MVYIKYHNKWAYNTLLPSVLTGVKLDLLHQGKNSDEEVVIGVQIVSTKDRVHRQALVDIVTKLGAE